MWAKNKNSGFTIVELLVVIVVIGILAAISIVSYSGITARARDTQRQSDLSHIQEALELFKIDKGGYPMCGSSGVFVAGSGNNSVCTVTGITQLYTGGYLPSNLKDPQNSGAYQYQYAVGFRAASYGYCGMDGSMNYILGAKLEASSNATYTCWSQTLNFYTGTNN